MPAFHRRLYENFPLYARLCDEEGVLEHVADAFQPDLDTFFRLLSRQETLYNPELTDSEWLDWLGQFVGLAPRGDFYLGNGLNPKWEPDHKREVINSAWNYWRLKGTERGIREGIFLWLLWEPDADRRERLTIQLPFGKAPTSSPPSWWDYYTLYDDYLTDTWQDRRHFGSGDYTSDHQSQGFSVEAPNWFWGYDETWSNRRLEQVVEPSIQSFGSALGPERPHLHLEPTIENWNLVFPDIITLNPEIWNINALVTTWGWLNFGGTSGDAGSITPVQLKHNSLLPSTSRTFQVKIDGLQWGEMWPYDVDVTPAPCRIKEYSITFDIYPGEQWGEEWETEWWYVGWRSILQQDITCDVESSQVSILAKSSSIESEIASELEASVWSIVAPQINALETSLSEAAILDVVAADTLFEADFNSAILDNRTTPIINFAANNIDGLSEGLEPVPSAEILFVASQFNSAAEITLATLPALLSINVNDIYGTAIAEVAVGNVSFSTDNSDSTAFEDLSSTDISFTASEVNSSAFADTQVASLSLQSIDTDSTAFADSSSSEISFVASAENSNIDTGDISFTASEIDSSAFADAQVASLSLQSIDTDSTAFADSSSSTVNFAAEMAVDLVETSSMSLAANSLDSTNYDNSETANLSIIATSLESTESETISNGETSFAASSVDAFTEATITAESAFITFDSSAIASSSDATSTAQTANTTSTASEVSGTNYDWYFMNIVA